VHRGGGDELGHGKGSVQHELVAHTTHMQLML